MQRNISKSREIKMVVSELFRDINIEDVDYKGFNSGTHNISVDIDHFDFSLSYYRLDYMEFCKDSILIEITDTKTYELYSINIQ